MQVVVGVPWRVPAAGNDRGEEVFGGLLGRLEVDLIENTSEDAQLQERTRLYQYTESMQLPGGQRVELDAEHTCHIPGRFLKLARAKARAANFQTWRVAPSPR